MTDSLFLRLLKRIDYRGPDDTQAFYDVSTNVRMGINRLEITDIAGKQPIRGTTSKGIEYVLVSNCEIYNHLQLRGNSDKTQDENNNIKMEKYNSFNDAEVLAQILSDTDPHKLYSNLYPKIESFRGMFAVTILDKTNKRLICARDSFGILPFYYGFNSHIISEMGFCSEAKPLIDYGFDRILEFPPGNVMIYDLTTFQIDMSKFDTERVWNKNFDQITFQRENIISRIREKLIESVKLQIPGLSNIDFPDALNRMKNDNIKFALLLSGGLDSTIILAIVRQLLGQNVDIYTYSVNIINDTIEKKDTTESTDSRYAKLAAKFYNTKHCQVEISLSDALSSLSRVIEHLETYDTTTIRASVPLFLLCERIKADGFKVILSGEGSDEIFGGYLYFKAAPNAREFFEETKSKLNNLSKFDCLRANKASAAFGLELRVPFLDQQFANFVMSIDPEMKMSNNRIEKYILREAFQDILPPEIYIRQKEQFSDGVGYNWIDELKRYAAFVYRNIPVLEYGSHYGKNTPRNPEEYLYRTIFHHIFSDRLDDTILWDPSIACSTARGTEWFKNARIIDPSGRSVLHHLSTKML